MSPAPFRFNRLTNSKTRLVHAALLLLATLLGSLTVRATEPEEGWQTIKNNYFSFSIPNTLKKVKVQGIDSFVERYEGDGIKLSFDYGWYSDNLEHWPPGTKYEDVKLGNDPAKLAVTLKADPAVNSTSSVGIYVKRAGEKAALGMYAGCDNEKAIALAKKILLTIRLAPPGTKDAK
ncbi:MAG TPA: hypothetical protein VGO11_02665 [Chthoniobacteraceae bacterium]|jgi:hypothetical protein|nr:hypothetical protein [Chthoniobacteraceae bacterium]